MNVKRINYFIGIDVSKLWLDVAVKKTTGNKKWLTFRCDNATDQLILLERYLIAEDIRLNGYTAVILEHTGIYNRTILDFLSKKKCKVFVEPGAKIKKSLGILRGKSDVIDARRLAEYGQRHYDTLRAWEPPRPALVLLKHLLTTRERIATCLARFTIPSSELKKIGTETEIKMIARVNQPVVTGLLSSKKKLDQQIHKLVRMDTIINKQVVLLKSVPHIGLVTALHLIACTKEFQLHTNGKTLACYVGVAPFEFSSGSSVKGKAKVSPFANKKMKALFHLAALRSIKQKGIFRNYYERKVKAGKHKMSVINAIRNKLVLRVAAVIERETPYLPDSMLLKLGKAHKLNTI